tara:strand:+ start:4309 stop:4794 length:486 start_codon:yes stop_codon:yes gene_type:complete
VEESLDPCYKEVLNKLRNQLKQKQLISQMTNAKARGVTLDDILVLIFQYENQAKVLRHLGLSPKQSTLTVFIQKQTGWNIMQYTGSLRKKLCELSDSFAKKEQVTVVAVKEEETPVELVEDIQRFCSLSGETAVLLADITEFLNLDEAQLKLVTRLSVIIP